MEGLLSTGPTPSSFIEGYTLHRNCSADSTHQPVVILTQREGVESRVRFMVYFISLLLLDERLNKVKQDIILSNIYIKKISGP